MIDRRDIKCPKCNDLVFCGSEFDTNTGTLKSGQKDGDRFEKYCKKCKINFEVVVEIVPIYWTGVENN